MNYFEYGFVAGLEKTSNDNIISDIYNNTILPYTGAQLGAWGLTKLPYAAAKTFGKRVGGVLGGPLGWALTTLGVIDYGYSGLKWGHKKYKEHVRHNIFEDFVGSAPQKPGSSYLDVLSDYGMTS